MDKLLSSWSSSVQSIPKSYIFPVDSRPGESIIPFCDTLPVINLGTTLGRERHDAVQQVLEACQQFGIFQLVNHGVDDDLVSDTMRVVKELTCQERTRRNITQKTQIKNVGPSLAVMTTRIKRFICSGIAYDTNAMHPLDECSPSWPRKPTRYQ